jgi:hypothetical protein
MRTSLILLSFSLITISCIQIFANKSVDLSNDELHQEVKYQTESELFDYVQTIKGTWVIKDYFESIIKYKSPYKTQNENPYYLIYIEPERIKDKMIGIYDYEYGQTEISNISYYSLINNSLMYEYNTFDGDVINDGGFKFFTKISLMIDKKDTILHVERSDNKSFDLKRIDNNCIDKTSDCEITQFITSKLLQGEYELRDEDNLTKPVKITIDSYGRVTGNSTFKRIILWDFFREINGFFEFDVAELIPANSSDNNFGFYNDNIENLFKFENIGDTIVLKRLRCEMECDNVEVSKVRYYLIPK